MASKLLNVLDSIEKGRQRIIDRANFHDFNLSSNASFDEIASVFELITPDYIPEKETVQDPWVFPDYLHDVHDIINNAENITYEGREYRPLLIMTYKDDAETSVFNKNVLYTASYVLFKTSDGSTYLDPANITHTWDDIDNKYVIVYWGYGTSNTWTFSLGSNNGNTVTQFIIKEGLDDATSGWTNVSDCQELVNFEAPSITHIGYQCSYLWNNCPKLEHISAPNLEHVPATNTPVVASNCPSLYNVELPKLKSFVKGYLYYKVPKLKGVNLSQFEYLSGSNETSGTTTLGSVWSSDNESYYLNRDVWFPTELYIPNLLEWNMNGATTIFAAPIRQFFPGVFYFKTGATEFRKGFRMDDLINFDYESGAIFNIMVLHSLRDYSFNKPCFIKSLTSENLKHVDFTNVTFLTTNDYIQLGCAPSCTSAIFPENISTNINIKYYNLLDRESLLDLFNKLSTVEGKTVTLCDEQKAKLSEDDLAIATEKGWTVV